MANATKDEAAKKATKDEAAKKAEAKQAETEERGRTDRAADLDRAAEHAADDTDPTKGCDEAIDAVVEDLNPVMNDDRLSHPALSRAITRLTEAKNALHDFRASRGFLPEDTFPADPPNTAKTESTSGR